jgi:GNAT superfamily N-acetyltransferase
MSGSAPFAGPASEVIVRQAMPDDAPHVLGLIKALATYERMPDAVKMDEALLTHAMREGHCRALLAFDGETPVGVALYFFNFSTWTGRRGLYLEDLFVIPEARKGGIGLAFFRELARIAIAENCPRMEWQVLEWNELAHGFYRGLGAAPMTEWRVWRLDTDSLQSLATG